MKGEVRPHLDPGLDCETNEPSRNGPSRRSEAGHVSVPSVKGRTLTLRLPSEAAGELWLTALFLHDGHALGPAHNRHVVTLRDAGSSDRRDRSDGSNGRRYGLVVFEPLRACCRLHQHRIGMGRLVYRGGSLPDDLRRFLLDVVVDPTVEETAIGVAWPPAHLRPDTDPHKDDQGSKHEPPEVLQGQVALLLSPITDRDDKIGSLAGHVAVLYGKHAARKGAQMTQIAIVGAGWGARVQVPTFREAGLDVVQATRDHWREVIHRPGVDLVSIVTPPSEHREMVLAALAAGKHVLCEKPTALDASEAEELVAAANEHPGRIALIDHELRFLPSWREARTRIATELGEVRYAEMKYSSPARGDRMRAWNWWSDASRGGGIWGAVGSHFVDALRYFGLEPESVRATLATVIGQRPFEAETRPVTADDFGAIQLRLRGGALAIMQFSVVATGPDEPSVMTIYGELGAMRFIGEEVLLSRGGAAFARMAGGPLEQRPGNSPGGAFGTGTLHLGRALRAALDDGDRQALAPAATFTDGLMQQRVLDAARESSANEGGWVQA